MSNIVSAILNRDVDQIRSILRDNSDLKGFKSESGLTIFELAKKTNSSLIEACIYKETERDIESPEEILYGILASLSDLYFGFQYESGIEHMVWHCIKNDGKWPNDFCSDIDGDTLTDINYVISKTGSWYSNEVGVILVATWENEYVR